MKLLFIENFCNCIIINNDFVTDLRSMNVFSTNKNKIYKIFRTERLSYSNGSRRTMQQRERKKEKKERKRERKRKGTEREREKEGEEREGGREREKSR